MSELDPLIHVPARLRIMTRLIEVLPLPEDQITFPELQRQLEMTAGNLTTHLGKLEAAGYLGIEKSYEGRRPASYISMTERGRAAFAEYRVTLLRLLGEGDARSAPSS